MNDTKTSLDVYTFGPAWDIPVLSASPFGVKLITWLRMHDLPHTVHVENNPAKGPKSKCPWVVVDGEAIGDSELVIQTIKARRGIETDTGLTPQQRAIALAIRLMLEDHYHQVWEHQLFIFEGGWKRAYEFFDQLPPGVRVLVRTMARSALRKQLFARGVGRHTHEQIVQMGIEDLDVLDTLIGNGPFFFGEEPTDIDATVFAFLSLTYWTPSESPVWSHLRSRRSLCDYCERIRERWF